MEPNSSINGSLLVLLIKRHETTANADLAFVCNEIFQIMVRASKSQWKFIKQKAAARVLNSQRLSAVQFLELRQVGIAAHENSAN